MTFKIQGIDHVQLAAPEGCEEKARAFYGNILGLEEIPKPAELRKRGGCWFLCGSQELHIGVEQKFSPAKKAHPAFYVQHIEYFQEKLTQKGVAVIVDTARPDVTRFYVLDPFGNRIEFMERKNR
ncbi:MULTISPECIES: VOC family protein [unclassified Bacillus (in: firmicutes)]|uniref:VOC family protein n=1 Tax=unclassified Bacillus (in: firmicutes) TaxID=185979 RepID=UPI0008F2D9E2|nr:MULTISPECIES: VOC family protein [unclassified Bacillus (in: firmicutes)]SFI31215.1 Glyoxalase/Bleomycin resistance protein/Dioxygenase superfamily protein [Bacillus sp. 71mf]SFS37906.1 Glyoxalase/Bleomycin resistance protein/Dioxygenase superfamily protein [Bacillus sp. 103mf]